MKHLLPLTLAFSLLATIALATSPEDTAAHFTGWTEPAWVNPLEKVKGQVRVEAIDDIAEVKVVYSYPDGTQGDTTAERDEADSNLFSFAIPSESGAGLGDFTYQIEVLHKAGTTTSPKHVIPMGYEEDLDITANPPEILWYPLGDKSATVRYKACCNILGASIIAQRIPVNPQGSSAGLPDDLYSDFVWLEPDALSASTAGLYFEFGFNPADFASTAKKHPVIYEFDWKDRDWSPVLTFEVVDGKTMDFPATEGGIFVLGKE